MRDLEIPAWVAPWIGRPYAVRGRGPDAFDCWGLVAAVVAERWGLELPSHAGEYETAADRHDLAAVVAGGQSEWTEISPAAARVGDVVVLRLAGAECHVGLVVAPGWFLHSLRGCDSVIESWEHAAWRNRLAGVWRHAEIQARALEVAGA